MKESVVMRSLAIVASAVVAFVTVAIPRVHATAFDAVTILVNASAPGNAGGFSNVTGTADITKHGSAFVGPGNPHDEGTGIASTVGFYSTFVIAPGFISNLGRASAAASTINTDGGPTGVGAGAEAHFRLFVEVIPDPSLPASVLGAVPVDVGWHVAGSHTAGGNDFAEIAVSQMTAGGPDSGRISKFVESAVDADRSGVTTVFVNLSPATGLDNQLAVDLRAVCFSTGFSVVPQVTSTACSATADPTFSIPADFPFADRIRLDFSPNLAPPSAVAAPATGWLAVVAMLLLGARRQLRRRRSTVASRGIPRVSRRR
jgi:hypothetical protein